MNRYDQKIFFTALAFMAVVQKDGRPTEEDRAQRVMALAALLGDFCARNVPSFMLPVLEGDDDKDTAAALDAIIERHIKDLRENETSILPEDKPSLMQMYVRLQFRKIHRINAALFSGIDRDKLADHVLSQLDEEIDYHESLS